MEVVCESAQPCIDRMNICCKYMDTHLLAVLPNTDNHKINITVFLLHLPLFMSFIALHVYLIQLYPCSTGECTEYRNSLFKISVVGLPFYFEGFFPPSSSHWLLCRLHENTHRNSGCYHQIHLNNIH